MAPQLLALSKGPNILLDKPILLVGRGPECDIQIQSRKVSRRHCCIARVRSYLVVRDLGSTNGVRVNGVRVREGRLQGGDELMIGSHRYQVCWDAGLARPVVRQGIPVIVDDESLDSCDEPVALREDPDPLPAVAAPEAVDIAASPPSARTSLVLPDEIELAPESSIVPRAAGPT